MKKKLLEGLKFGYTVAVGKLHIVKSERNPDRITAFCGKILTDVFNYTTTKTDENNICNYCEFMYNRYKLKNQPIGG